MAVDLAWIQKSVRFRMDSLDPPHVPRRPADSDVFLFSAAAACPAARRRPLCAQVLRDVIQGRATARPAPSDRDRVSGVAGLAL